RAPGQLHQPRGHCPVPAPADRRAAAPEGVVGGPRGAGGRPRPRPGLRRRLRRPAGCRPGHPGAGRARPAAVRRTRGTAGPRRPGAPVNDLYNNAIGHWVIVVIAIALVLFVLLTGTAYTVWFERVALGRIQRRPGPNRVGPYGLMQLAADGIKLAFKESFVPAKTDKVLFVVAPTIAVAAAFLSWSVIPIGLWYNVQYWIADVNIGILLIFAFSSLNVYAIVIGGYASNNKYSL